MTGFDIAELRIGAGMGALCPLPSGPQARAALRAWQPDLVITMTPAAELAALDCADLPEWLGSCGIGWAAMPVADFGAPGDDICWRSLSERAHALLDSGGRVLVHCRGGCGRSGMILLRLMTERGEEAQAALARLRAARPCAVETEGQMAWAVAGAMPTGAKRGQA